jgi:hypothetical protein
MCHNTFHDISILQIVLDWYNGLPIYLAYTENIGIYQPNNKLLAKKKRSSILADMLVQIYQYRQTFRILANL